jgi:hypothetical protein
MAEKELTISQALRKIKEIKGKVARHSTNAMTSVTHKTESPPAYGFEAEWEKAHSYVEELLEIQSRVAIANAKTTLDYEGKTRTLVWCTKKLVEIKGSIAWYTGLAVRAHAETIEQEYNYDSAAHGQVRVATMYTCHLPEAKKAECIQALETKFADLNDIVENINHRTLV